MIEHELQPWIVLAGSLPALWKIADTQAPALILFSSPRRAQDYIDRLNEANSQSLQPSRTELLAIMIQCFQQQIHWAVLDPSEASASRIFNLRDVLKAARESLK